MFYSMNITNFPIPFCIFFKLNKNGWIIQHRLISPNRVFNSAAVEVEVVVFLNKLHFQKFVSSIDINMENYQELRSVSMYLSCLVGKGASRSQGMLMAMKSVSSLQYVVPSVLREHPPVTQQSCRNMTPVWPLFMNSWVKEKARGRAHVQQRLQPLRSMYTERTKPWRSVCTFNSFMMMMMMMRRKAQTKQVQFKLVYDPAWWWNQKNDAMILSFRMFFYSTASSFSLCCESEPWFSVWKKKCDS